MLSSTACPENSGKSRTAGKTFLQTLFFFFLISKICFAQWFTQYSDTTIWLTSICLIDSNTGWAVGGSEPYGTDVILKTTDGGNSWISKTVFDIGCLSSVYFTDINTGWAVGPWINYNESLIIKTSDGGDNWVMQSGDVQNLYSVYFSDSDNGTAVGIGWGGMAILTTSDGGTNWLSKYFGVGSLLRSVFYIDSNTGWAVGGGGNGALIIKTTDGGEHWVLQVVGGYYGELNTVYFTDNNTGWAAGNSGVILKTTDGGEHWNYTPGLSTNCSSLILTDNYTGWIVGDGGKIFKTTNGGEQWILQQSGVVSNLRSVYFIDSNTGWVVGDNGIILHTTNGGVSFVGDESNHTSFFDLLQNYPNPFNPSTKISYSIPEYSNVTIKIFDILGNEIETLVNEEKPAGTYEISWYAANPPSGVYFYQLKATPSGGQAGSFVETKKMLLLK
jgi:photosystem II stability/assembly factor-like uncharacterized protein